MNKSGSCKRVLLMSLLSLVMCCAMLVGSTFAWFTDSVTSGTNKIVAGNLDVALYHDVDGAETEVTGDTVLFAKNAAGETFNWEPGAVAYETFTVKNVGSLALKYKLALKDVAKNFVVESGVTTGRSLVDVIKVAVTTDEITDRDHATEGKTFTSLEDFEAPTGSLEPEEEASFTVILYWQQNTEVDNLYNLVDDKTAGTFKGEPATSLMIEFATELTASQYTYESDSFDDQYDKDAKDENGDPIALTSAKKEVTATEAQAEEMTFVFDNTAPVPEDADPENTTVVFEAGAIDITSDGEKHTVVCKIKTSYDDYATVEGSVKVGVATIDLSLFVDGEEIHDFVSGKKVTISTKIMTGLKDVEIVYNGEGDAPADMNYNPATGELSFTTTHFSEFFVRGVPLINTTDALKKALEDVAAGASTTVSLDGDIELNAGASEALAITAGDVTIDLNGHTLTVKNEEGKGITVAAGATLNLTDSSESGELVLGTCKSGKQAIVAAKGTRNNTATVNFENIKVTVENTAHGATSDANGNFSAVYAGDYATVTFGQDTVITATDEEAVHCNAYVAYADGSHSVVTIAGADVTADGTVTPFATGNGTLNMESGKITISSNNGCAALMVARGSGVVNMTGGAIEVTGNLTGGRGGSSAASWGSKFKDYCFGVATTWTADDDEAELNVTGGVIELTPTAGTAVGVATTFPSCWSRGEVSGSAEINCKAAEGAVARAVGAMDGSPLGIDDSAVTAVFKTGGDNDVIADEGPFPTQSSFGGPVIDRRTNQ